MFVVHHEEAVVAILRDRNIVRGINLHAHPAIVLGTDIENTAPAEYEADFVVGPIDATMRD